MEFQDNVITIPLDTDFFADKPDVYKIMIDYNVCPPKFHQVNCLNWFERRIRIQENSKVLRLEGVSLSHEGDSQHVLAGLNRRGCKDCLNIISSIIEYPSGARQSFAVMEQHYNKKHEEEIPHHPHIQMSYFDEILAFTKKLKLRSGYDKFLTAIQPFYKKHLVTIRPAAAQRDTISLYTDTAAAQIKYSAPNQARKEQVATLCVDMSAKQIADGVLGLHRIKLRASVQLYARPQNQAEVGITPMQRKSTKMLLTSEADAHSVVECALWIKIPMAKLTKSDPIQGWNDILMQRVKVDLARYIKPIMEGDLPQITVPIKFNLDLANNYGSMALWNPSLLFADVEFSGA